MASSRREYFRRTRKVRMRELTHSKSGWTGAVAAFLAVLLFFASVLLSYKNGGEADWLVGSLGLFGLVLSLGAFCLGIVSLREERVRPAAPQISFWLGLVMTILLGGLYAFGCL